MEVLPDEIFLHIFSFLNLSERKNARLVCKDWLRICSDRLITKKDMLAFDYYKLAESDFANGETATIMNLAKVKLNVRQCTKGRQDSYYFKTYGACVKSVSITFEHSCQCVFLDIIKYCKNLVNLECYDSLWFIGGCDCLDENSANSEQDLITSITDCGNPLKLKTIRFDTYHYGYFMLSLAEKLITYHGKLLKEFSYTTHSGYSRLGVSEMLKCLNPKLNKLWMQLHYEPDDFIFISEKFSNLHELYLHTNDESPGMNINNEADKPYDLASLCNKLTFLKRIYIRGLIISLAEAKALASMPNLLCVELRDCPIGNYEIKIIREKAILKLIG